MTTTEASPVRYAAQGGVRTTAWQLAVTGHRLLARPTAALRAMPDFVIVGAQRAGTTSLFEYLSDHPGVVAPALSKGVHYFDTGFARGPAWYRSHFPLRWRLRHRSEQLGMPALTGEASPYYLFHPLAPERIADLLPEVRIIVVLRDPVTRAWSHYHHEIGRGFEELPFEDALRAETRRLTGEVGRICADPTYVGFHHQHHSYLARGRYLPQLRRLWAHVPRDRVLVLESGAFSRDPGAGLARVCEFLGIAPPPATPRTHHNARAYRPLPRHLERELADHFRPHNERLFEELGVDWAWTT